MHVMLTHARFAGHVCEFSRTQLAVVVAVTMDTPPTYTCLVGKIEYK